MKVWLVGICDCESNSVKCICSTKEIAERELFKERDRLIKFWEKQDKYLQKSIKEFNKDRSDKMTEDPMYRGMIKALSSNDYENWDNFPHDRPYISELGIVNV